MELLDRRTFLKGAAALAGSLALGDFAWAASSGTQPNIILVVADDLGWRDLGCYGDTNYSSPNIDRIANEGVKFTNAFVTASSCSPSRASIMTGQAPHSVGVLGLTHKHPQYQMSTKVPTLSEALRRKGYRTAIAGKWHVAPYRPTKQYGYTDQLDVAEILNTDRILPFIDENNSSNTPFFMELNFFQTHRPNFGGFDYKQHPDFPIDTDKVSVPDYWQIPDMPEMHADLAGYYSQSAWMDFMVGQILDKLEILGITENTLVAFVSDNGPNYPGVKATCYDRGIGTPLMLRMPGTIPQGKEFDQMVSTIDIMPTCLAAAGMNAPKQVQGQSLLPLINEQTDVVHDAVFSEITYHVIYTPMRSIRTTDYKYIENLSDDQVGLDLCEDFPWAQEMSKLPGQRCCVERPPEELYDLKADPDEKNNLASDPEYAIIKSQLTDRLHKWRTETKDPFPDI